MKAKFLSALLLVVSVFGLLSGAAWLIHLRFESGEAYPVASSLRADPMGAKVLYESYAGVPGLDVQRNFVPFGEIEDLPQNALLLLLNEGGQGMFGLAQFDAVERFVTSGGRVVVALDPDRVAYKYLESDEESASDEDSLEGDDDERKGVFARRAQATEVRFWGALSMVHGEHSGGDAECVSLDDVAELPLVLPWREGGVLAELGDDWTAVYQIDEEVVVAERQLGRGTIVVMTDDYLFSNEALLKHRYSGLLTWVLGDAETVIFDETHLGVMESTGVAVLMRRYRLSGFFLGFAVLMALVVWRGMSPLLPMHTGRTKGNVVLAEHSTEAGLSDLVRRSVSATDLPREAFSQWKQSFIRNTADEAHYAKEIQEVQLLLAEYAAEPTRKRRPMELHLKIQNIINRKKRRRL